MEIISFLGNRFLKEGFPEEKFTIIGEFKRPPFARVVEEYDIEDERIIASILYKKFFNEDSILTKDDKSLIESEKTNKTQKTKIRLALSALIDNAVETSDINYIKEKISDSKIKIQWNVEADFILIKSICGGYMPTTISIYGGILLFGKDKVQERFFNRICEGSLLYQNVAFLEKYGFEYSEAQKTFLTSENYNEVNASFYSLKSVSKWVEIDHVLFSHANGHKYANIFLRAYIKGKTNAQVCSEIWEYWQYREMGGWLIDLLKFKEGERVKCVSSSQEGVYLFKRNRIHYFKNKEGCIIGSTRIISI